jgi:hypothetical protein
VNVIGTTFRNRGLSLMLIQLQMRSHTHTHTFSLSLSLLDMFVVNFNEGLIFDDCFFFLLNWLDLGDVE